MNRNPLLDYEINPFQGAVVEASTFSGDPDDFACSLGLTLEDCEEKGIQLVWLNLPVRQADLVPVAVRSGFSYHHADDNGLQLVKKITPARRSSDR